MTSTPSTHSTPSPGTARPPVPAAHAPVTVTLIPAYHPDDRLVRLVEALRAAGTGPVVVVDDGSGPAYRSVFEQAGAAGAELVAHPHNRGKGAALRTGFTHVLGAHPGADVVCADCDGQHTPADVARVAAALAADRQAVGRADGRGAGHAVVLGARAFSGKVPPRSRFGNMMTRFAFFAAARQHLQDTQTGLRGYHADQLAWLCTIPGDRFEYELNILLEAARTGVPMREVPIATVYLDGNASSHFRSIRDSARVYAPLVRFSASSLAAFGVDFTLVVLLEALTDDLALSVVVARLASATINFLANRGLVFGSKRSPASSAVRYAALAIAVVAANYALLALLTRQIGVPLVGAKVLVEAVLFAVSYQLQKRVVFGGRQRPAPSPAS